MARDEGRDARVMAGTTVSPYRIAVAEDRLNHVRDRLRTCEWPRAPNDAGWRFGVDRDVLRDLSDHLAGDYDWRAHEARLNALPQLAVTIDDIAINVIHHRAAADAPTVMLIHGWPGSCLEFLDVADRLVATGIGVVIPSLPGCGFSDPPSTVIGPRSVARLFARMMAALSVDRYVAQGGDIGAAVASWLGHDDPKCVAVHLNYVAAWFKYDQPARTAEEETALANRAALLAEDGGYAHVQATRFQDIAYALADSPIGAAAWILARFKRRIDDLWNVYDREAIATHIMLYLLTGSLPTSTWIYRGIVDERPSGDMRVAKPTAVAHFAGERAWLPRSFVAQNYDIVRWTEYPLGGHFAAMEQPGPFAADVAAFVAAL